MPKKNALDFRGHSFVPQKASANGESLTEGGSSWRKSPHRSHGLPGNTMLPSHRKAYA
jgi:hypothetical protein